MARLAIALVILSLCLPTSSRAQVTASPGDSVRIRFFDLDRWHGAIVTDQFRDTIVVRDCFGCTRNRFTAASVARIEAFRQSEGNTGHSAVIGLIVGATAGVAIGGLQERHCSSFDSNTSGQKCLGFGAPILGLAGGLAGCVVGAVIGHRRNSHKWENVSVLPSPTLPTSSLARLRATGDTMSETANSTNSRSPTMLIVKR